MNAVAELTFYSDSQPREENRHADLLANLAIDERTPLPEWLALEIPTS